MTTSVASKALRPDQQAKFQKWKTTFNKNYATPDDEAKAMEKVLKNFDEIEAHNKRFQEGKETFQRGLWKRSDLSFEEKRKLLAGSTELTSSTQTTQAPVLLQAASPNTFKASPSSVNWTAAGLVQQQNIMMKSQINASVGHATHSPLLELLKASC